MKKFCATAVLLVCGAAFTLNGAPAADAPKTVANEKKVEAKAEKYTPATTIDFGGELGLSFDTLTSLGARIEAARRGPDPVALTLAALELGAAEKVAGKKAGLSADALLKEALGTANLRGSSKELLLVAELVKDDKTAKDLRTAAEKAADREKTEAEAVKTGEQPRGANFLRVTNHSHEDVDIFVDGRCVGRVLPHHTETFGIQMRFRHVNLMARHHHHSWSSDIEGQHEFYSWELRE